MLVSSPGSYILIVESRNTTSYPYNKLALFGLDHPQVVFITSLTVHRMKADWSVLEKWLINRLNPSIPPGWILPLPLPNYARSTPIFASL